MKNKSDLIKSILDQETGCMPPSPFLRTEYVDWDCPRCKNKSLEVTRMVLTGPYSGTVMCKECGYRDSVLAMLGKMMIQVDPLPDGAAPVFFLDDEVDNEGH